VGDLLQLELGPRRGLRRGTSATAWYVQGCALELIDPARAMAAYERAIAGRPDLADAYNNLGRVLHDHHDRGPAPGVLPRAESYYRLALCIDPEVGLYWFNLGVVVEDQRRIGEAIAAYERALVLDPGLADAHFNLARLLELVGRQTADELVLRRAVRHLVRYRDLAHTG
jgi:tetratricopeptide (TPR) repeat protein